MCGAEIIFSKPTNKGFLPDLVSQGMLLNLLSFSVAIGYDFYGAWQSRQKLVIFILDESGAAPPTIGGLTVAVKDSGNLMEHPPVTLRATPLSPKLLGSFGPSPITITRVMAADSLNNNAKYTNNDVITIQFSENTDKEFL